VRSHETQESEPRGAVALHALTQSRKTAVHARAHGLLGHAELARDVREVLPAQEAQEDRRAVGLVERVHLSGEPPVQRELLDHLERGPLRPAWRRSGLARHPPRPPAQLLPQHIAQHRRQPRAQASAPTCSPLERREECVLHRVLGHLRIAHKPPSERLQPLEVLEPQLARGGRVAHACEDAAGPSGASRKRGFWSAARAQGGVRPARRVVDSEREQSRAATCPGQLAAWRAFTRGIESGRVRRGRLGGYRKRQAQLIEQVLERTRPAPPKASRVPLIRFRSTPARVPASPNPVGSNHTSRL
jgi:hypothetical protein